MSAPQKKETSIREVHVLHRYWIWADAMSLLFGNELKRIGRFDPDGDNSIHALMYMSYWYAALYVVVEGWRALGLADPIVDPLLESTHVDLLRRYRNGVFHFQRKYWSEKIIGFVSGGAESATWVRQLHDALGNALLARLRSIDTKSG